MLTFTTRALGALACLAIPFADARAQSGGSAPDGPVFAPAEIEHGIGMSAGECAAYRSTVWIVSQGGGICFRYYLSQAGGTSDQVVYYLSGDKSGDRLAYRPSDFDAVAASLSRLYGRPAVYLARMGLDGSSGWHAKLRRTWLEVEATHLAIDAVNARHGFRIVHVMGQSGGGHLTGALLGTRSDLGCALPGSGRLAFEERSTAFEERKEPIRRHYDPHSALDRVVQASSRARILVLTDPGDRRVPAAVQTSFVRDVQRAGGRISQFFITATDEMSHGSTPYLRLAMKECLDGSTDDEIRTKLARLSETRWQAELARSRTGGGQPAPTATLSLPAPMTSAATGHTRQPVVAAPPPAHYAQSQPARPYVAAGSPPPPPAQLVR